MNQNPFVLWLSENLQRFATKSPKFFKIWQLVSGAATAVMGLPALLTSFGIALPPAVTFLQNKYAGAITFGMFIMSLLPTQNKIVGVSDAGKPLTATNKEVLPFTAKSEEKKIEDKPMPVLTPDSNPVADRNNPV